MPHTGELACNPGMCPRLGIELTTLWFAGQCSIYLATPARALYGLNFHFLPSLMGWTLQLSTVGYSFIVCLIISFGSRIYCFGPVHWPLKYTPLQSINIILINIVLLYFTIGWLTSTSNLHCLLISPTSLSAVPYVRLCLCMCSIFCYSAILKHVVCVYLTFHQWGWVSWKN